jgi:hypothetical protein
MGIEPTSEAWEASILPLYDARFFVSDDVIIQDEMHACTEAARTRKFRNLRTLRRVTTGSL